VTPSHGSNRLADMTTDEVRAFSSQPRTCVLVPVGSVEPHGPHLPLATDLVISEEACARAALALADIGARTLVAPSVPYGVTDYAAGFSGAIGVPREALEAFLRAIVQRLLADGFSHVCLVNNHLEPAHDAAVRAAIAGLPKGRASVACPLTRRWARTLSDEFKKGTCHAGQYETSLVMAAGTPVRAAYAGLAPVAISLSEGIKEGKATFQAMGIEHAYTGAPAAATREEGEALYAKLRDMIVAEVTEALEA
jgi:creatinine amidohydrolase